MSKKSVRLKAESQKRMISYDTQIQDHIDQYGPTPCDYLNHRQNMSHYYRGAYNAMIAYETQL